MAWGTPEDLGGPHGTPGDLGAENKLEEWKSLSPTGPLVV